MSKIRKMIRVLGIILIAIGIGIIAYPFYTNFVMKKQEVEILSAWESLSDVASTQSEESRIFQSNEDFEKKSLIVDTTKKIPFKITIPRINSEWVVNSGTDIATLKKGPGHYIGTALPGETGRCVVAGHRTTYGAPFNQVDVLKAGDEIILETIGNEEYIYLVTSQEEVPPSEISVLKQTENATLALTTCTPKFYATRRLIIYSELAE